MAIAQRAAVRRRGPRAVVAGAILVLALSGCVPASQESDRASRATTVTTDVQFGDAATGTAAAGNGDSVTLEVSLGDTYPADQIPEAAACRVRVSGGLTSAVAIPVRVAARLTSSSPQDVTVHLGNANGLATGGNITLAGEHHWAVKYSHTPQECQGSGSGAFPATVEFTGMSPGSSNDWTAWLVVPKAITAGDAAGRQVAGALVLSPLVVLGGRSLIPAWVLGQGNAVSCSASDPAAGDAGYIAIDPGVAKDHGCDANTQSASSEMRDRICLQAFPGSQQVSRTNSDGLMVYNRVASQYQVCAGFGSDDAFVWTPEMSCAAVALIADSVPGEAVKLVDALCNTDEFIDAFNSGQWLSAAGKQACETFGGVFSFAVAAMAGGATGPGAVVVGPVVYLALQTGISLACDGIFEGSGSILFDVADWLASNHEAAVASDIQQKGKCLGIRTQGAGSAAVDCPSS
jgi:hypothetical protein